MKIIDLKTPLSEKDVCYLKAGDIVTLTGTLWTCGSKFHIRALEDGVSPPIHTKDHYNVMLHSKPLVVKINGSWKFKAHSITTSISFEKWESKAIERFGLRAIIGKGKVGVGTLNAMRRFKCVHLIRSGLFAGAYARFVEKVKEVHWLDLGRPEAVWVIEVTHFGPLIVEADTYGKSLYMEVGEKIDKKIPTLHKRLSVKDAVYHEK